MATIVLGIVGNLIYPGVGGAIGAGVGAGIDAIVGSAIAKRLISSDVPPPDIRAFPGVDPGVPAPWVHGSAVRVPGTVIYMSEVRQRPIPGDEKGKDPTVTAGHNYFVDIAIAWCRNECFIDPVRKIWASGELIYTLNSQFFFTVEAYGIKNLDRWWEFFIRPTVEDGKPWCNRNRRPTERIFQIDQNMTWLAVPGSERDQLFESLKRAIGNTMITIAGCHNADNNGTFFCIGMSKMPFQHDNQNIYEVNCRRCRVFYPKDDPCEPFPTPCDPAVREVVPDEDPPNTITITAHIPNFSRYFVEIRNYTGDPDSTPTVNSEPNVGPDILITTDPEIDATTVPAFRGTCYSVIENLDITKWAGTVPQFEAQIRERNAATPETAVDALLARSEVQQSIRVDTSELFDGSTIILGLQEGGPSAPVNRVQELMNLFDFEAQEIQEILPGAVLPTPLLQFKFQADLPLIPIPYENTSARELGATGIVHARIRRSTKEALPQEFTLDYIDIKRDLQPNTTSYSVDSAPVQNRQKLATTVVMDPEQADITARKLLWKVINFSDQIEFETFPEQLEVVEGDRIELQSLEDGTTIRARVTSKTVGENGLIEIKAEIDDELAYDQLPGGGYAPDVVEQIDFASPGEARVMDMAPLTVADASVFGVYMALRTTRRDLTVSYGVFVSTDQVNWIEATRFSAPAVTGDATSILLPPSDDSNWDMINTVTIRMLGNSVLESLTQEEVSSGLNWAYLGGEIIGFTDAIRVESPENPQTEDYELSGLLRGRLDSFEFLTDHQIGDQFILLPPSGPGVGFIPLDPGRYQLETFVRVVPEGFSVFDTESAEGEVIMLPNAETLRPYSVHGVWAIRRPDYSTCVYATPRTRVPFRLWSGLIAPMVEVGDATDFRANVYTLNETSDAWVLRRQVCGCETVREQISFFYSREMIIDDLVNPGIISKPETVGQTRFEIFRISDSIGDGRAINFCLDTIGVKFEGECTIVEP